jgi:hypothetical protein
LKSENEFLVEVAHAGCSGQLKRTAFLALIDRQHRPTIERALEKLTEDRFTSARICHYGDGRMGE